MARIPFSVDPRRGSRLCVSRSASQSRFTFISCRIFGLRRCYSCASSPLTMRRIKCGRKHHFYPVPRYYDLTLVSSFIRLSTRRSPSSSPRYDPRTIVGSRARIALWHTSLLRRRVALLYRNTLVAITVTRALTLFII